MTIAITTNPSNLLQKLPYGTANATIAFTTDATAPFQVSVTSSAANGNNFFVASATGMVNGDFYSIPGAGLGGTVPWVVEDNGPAPTNVLQRNTALPSSRVTFSTAVAATKYERFETRFRAKKVTLTNLSNGDVHVWDQTLRDDQAYKNGSATPITDSAILNRSNCIAIHPNLLPFSNSFTLACEYDYYQPTP